MRANAKQVAACTGGSFVVEPMDPRALMTGVTWDSREVAAGDLYVALPGARVDGHAFVADALRKGALCTLVAAPPDDATCLLAREMGAAVVEVPDTRAAVTDLARWWRAQIGARVIAVTGSSGKTTTKNLVRDVLSRAASAVATAGNQNNELGVPKTLLAADVETEAVVVEMGMRGAGQIAELCDFALPDWGLVTNVGEAHIELLGSREGVASAKAELLEALPAGRGVAFLNAADDFCGFVRDRALLDARGVRTVLFDGTGEHAERLEARAAVAALSGGEADALVWADDVSLDEEGCPRFTLCASGFPPPARRGAAEAAAPGTGGFPSAAGAADPRGIERASCALVLRGVHNVSNACAAAAVGRAFGMALPDIAAALAASLPECGRQEVVAARGGFTVVNDAYNANPDSMRAALLAFASMETAGARIAVLGDMLELGGYARACHEGIGRLVAELPIDCLVCMGDEARSIASAAQGAGMDSEKVVVAETTSDVLGELDARVRPGDAVLVKASNSMGLARVVEGLVG